VALTGARLCGGVASGHNDRRMTTRLQQASDVASGLPDATISARDVFKIDSDLIVPAFSTADEHVPVRDPD
jgi:hypothetical protein